MPVVYTVNPLLVEPAVLFFNVAPNGRTIGDGCTTRDGRTIFSITSSSQVDDSGSRSVSMTINLLLLDINHELAYFMPNRAAPLKKTIGEGVKGDSHSFLHFWYP